MNPSRYFKLVGLVGYLLEHANNSGTEPLDLDAPSVDRFERDTVRDATARAIGISEILLADYLCHLVAQLHEAATVRALLAVAPIRLATIVRLDRDRHLLRDSDGRITGILMSASETKSGVAIEVAVTTDLANRLERHLVDFRPFIFGNERSARILVGRNAEPLSVAQLRARLQLQSLLT